MYDQTLLFSTTRFFYYLSADLLDLHSFPTRRSSDLFLDRTFKGKISRVSPAVNEQTRSLTIERSEEHTSELQSLTNLVCRLLLEKKNDPSEGPAHWLRRRNPINSQIRRSDLFHHPAL